MLKKEVIHVSGRLYLDGEIAEVWWSVFICVFLPRLLLLETFLGRLIQRAVLFTDTVWPPASCRTSASSVLLNPYFTWYFMQTEAQWIFNCNYVEYFCVWERNLRFLQATGDIPYFVPELPGSSQQFWCPPSFSECSNMDTVMIKCPHHSISQISHMCGFLGYSPLWAEESKY